MRVCNGASPTTTSRRPCRLLHVHEAGWSKGTPPSAPSFPSPSSHHPTCTSLLTISSHRPLPPKTPHPRTLDAHQLHVLPVLPLRRPPWVPHPSRPYIFDAACQPHANNRLGPHLLSSLCLAAAEQRRLIYRPRTGSSSSFGSVIVQYFLRIVFLGHVVSSPSHLSLFGTAFAIVHIM